MIELFKRASNHVETNYPKHAKAGRFVISGALATATNLGILFVLTHLFNVWYLFSSCVAFILSFVVSFSLQKFWTWRDHAVENIHHQAGKYLVVTLTGLGANTLLMYLLVDRAQIHYLLAQIIAAAVIALYNFFLYQKLIFKTRHDAEPV
ncbi:MAG TPA: GtrA family protein [Candidatus Paceibacterota bacterium]|jgi:Predicted membrane protein